MTVHRGPRGLTRLLSALGEPTRRRVYELLRRADRPLTRVEVATELRIGVRLAAFHLDRLVEEGLLAAHYARPPDRAGGPGAGRPAKWYVANEARFDVTVPARRYDVVARILLAALPETASTDLLARAGEYGLALARDHRAEPLDQVLVELGYEPRPGQDGAVELVNCPFHELAEQARETTCTINHAFLEGLTSGLDPARTAVLDPRPRHCCVRVLPRDGRC